MNYPVFTCTRPECGAKHPGVLIQRGEDISDEKRAELRATWHRAIDKLNAKYDDKSASKEAVADAEALERKTCALYMNTIRWEQWLAPDTIITVKVKDVHYLRCQLGTCKDEV